MRLWIDDIREPPSSDWLWCRTVRDAKAMVHWYEHQYQDDTIYIDIDHDAGIYASQGGDYIKLLDWFEEQGIVDTGYFFHIHSMNVVGVENMRRIIQKNGWREV